MHDDTYQFKFIEINPFLDATLPCKFVGVNFMESVLFDRPAAMQQKKILSDR